MSCPDYPLFQSQKGHYFIGQTPTLSGQNAHALVNLVNPSHSDVNIYVNAITVTNISSLNISTEIYLSSIEQPGLLAQSVSCTNLSFIPLPHPRGEIHYLTTTSQPPHRSTNIFGRIVSSYSTSIIDGSQIIIGPGKALSIYLGGYLPIALKSTIVALGWWEESIDDACIMCEN